MCRPLWWRLQGKELLLSGPISDSCFCAGHPTAEPNFGLFDDDIEANSASTLNLDFHHSDGGRGFTLWSYTPEQGTAISDYCGFSLNQWYHVMIEYDAESNTASYEITQNGSVVSSNSLNITGSYQGLAYLGFSRVLNLGYAGYTTIAYVDNVELYIKDGTPLQITLTPYGTPIVIPSTGGSFSYDVTVSNNTWPDPFDVWVNIELPMGIQFTTLNVNGISIPQGSSITRQRVQSVPENAPAGEYISWGSIGIYPWTIVDYNSFTFVKEGNGDIWYGPEGWFCTGEPFPGEFISSDNTQPAEFALQSAYPNPFNPSTLLTYSLPSPEFITLSIYDVQGRLVSTLVSGFRDAGIHEITFNAENLPSGIYFARLQAGGKQSSQKLVLLK